MDNREILAELAAAQRDVKSIDEARARRQQAVTVALAAGWSKYKIAKALGVAPATVDAIIAAGGR